MGSNAGALFEVVWGLVVTGFGWITALNVRGAAERFLRMSEASVASAMWRRSPVGGWSVGVRGMRALGFLFAVVGPVVLVRGLIRLSDRGLAWDASLPPLPAPFLIVFAVITALTAWRFWRPSGMARRAWAEGGRIGRVAAAVLTAMLAAFCLALWSGSLTALLLAWLVGALAALTLLLAGPAPEPRHS
ncbi:hypothetical protein ACWDYJ_15885 [Streptomyces sp. NPDC003042]